MTVFSYVDGFGVVIATIVMAGKGNIVIVDPGTEPAKSYSFPAVEGDIYLLSGHVRNVCLHGVYASCNERESLNLRFGMHSAAFAQSEIDNHWHEEDGDLDDDSDSVESSAAAKPKQRRRRRKATGWSGVDAAAKRKAKARQANPRIDPVQIRSLQSAA